LLCLSEVGRQPYNVNPMRMAGVLALFTVLYSLLTMSRKSKKSGKQKCFKKKKSNLLLENSRRGREEVLVV